MALREAPTATASAGLASKPYTLARVACLIGAVLAALLALVLCFGLLLWWAFQESEPSPVPRSTVAGAVLAWCIAGCLGWAAVGLTGRRADRARNAGLVGAAVGCLAGVWIALSPVMNPSAHGGGGWGEPWMPEFAFGGAVLAYGVWLTWLLRPAGGPRWKASQPARGMLPESTAPNDPTTPTAPTGSTYTLARAACLIGVVLTAFGALLAVFMGLGHSDTQLARLACVAFAVCIIGCLGWAAIGLAGGHADPATARRAGLAGAVLGCLASVWIVLSRVWPVLSPLRGIGGTLEYPIGGVTLAFGCWLLWLLRKR